MVKTIPLTKGKQALVDDRDYEFAFQHRWCCNNRGYAVRYYEENGKRKVESLHRTIMRRKLGGPIPRGAQVDHIDPTNKLDCTRDRLRLATRSQNLANRGLAINSTSGYKGVNWHQGHWEARIKVKGKRLILGAFDDPESAALMYDLAAKHFFGAFANLNMPELTPPPALELQFQKVLVRANRKGIKPLTAP